MLPPEPGHERVVALQAMLVGQQRCEAHAGADVASGILILSRCRSPQHVLGQHPMQQRRHDRVLRSQRLRRRTKPAVVPPVEFGVMGAH